METIDNGTGERTASTTDGVADQGAQVAKKQFDPEEQERLADRIRNLADRVRARKLPLDKVVAEVFQIVRILDTVALPMPPSPAHLLSAIDYLACELKAFGELKLAEPIAVRALALDVDQTGALRWQELRIAALADIWAGLGKLDDAKETYRYAAMLAQERLREEALVFVLLNRCAEIAMDAKDYEAAAVAYDRSMQMKAVNLNVLTMVNGIKDIIHKEALAKMGYLPIKNRIRTPVEVEYDRVAVARRREAQTKKGQEKGENDEPALA